MDNRINSNEDLKIYEQEKNFKIFAGPGAGKTHLIIENIKYIIQNSEELNNEFKKILCITYTNIAADEIIKRLDNFNNYTNVSTIHSFLYRNIIKVYQKQLKILIKDLYNINVGEDIVMRIRREGDSILAHTSVEEIKKWLKEHFDLDSYYINMLSKNIMKNCVLSLEKINKYPFENVDKVCLASDIKNNFVPKKYTYLVKEYLWSKLGVIDFDEILFFSYKLLRKYSFIKYDLRYRFPYIFIDEQQDTNPIQYEIIKLIFDNKDNTVGFIGDVAQSIYGFQGANYKMLNEAEFNSKAQVKYIIEGNRRSTKNIIHFCNYIRKVDSNLPKQRCELNYHNNSLVKIIMLINREYDVKNLIDENTTVLCRRFIDLFQYVNISDQIQRSNLISLYRTYNNILDVDLINEFNDENDENYDWIRAIKFIHLLNEGIKQKNFPLLVAQLEKYLLLDNIIKQSEGQFNYFTEFNKIIIELKKILEKKDMKFFDIIKIINNLFENSLFEYVNKVYDFDQEEKEPGIELIECLTLKTILEMCSKIFVNNSKYITIHKSKGKEYNKVLVDLKPSKINNESLVESIDVVLNPIIFSSNNGMKELCEFVRIFYVGISRAINELIVVLEGNRAQADELEANLSQYMIDENITDKFYEIIIK